MVALGDALFLSFLIFIISWAGEKFVATEEYVIAFLILSAKIRDSTQVKKNDASLLRLGYSSLERSSYVRLANLPYLHMMWPITNLKKGDAIHFILYPKFSYGSPSKPTMSGGEGLELCSIYKSQQLIYNKQSKAAKSQNLKRKCYERVFCAPNGNITN